MESNIPTWKGCIDVLDKCKEDFIVVSKQLENIRKDIRDSKCEIHSKKEDLNGFENPSKTSKEILDDAIKKSQTLQKEKSDNSRKEIKNSKDKAKKQLEDKKAIILNERKENLDKLYEEAEQSIKKYKESEEVLHQDTVSKYNDLQEISQQLQKAQQETEQIALYKSKISPEYENISSNSMLLDDIYSERYTREEIDNTVGSLNDVEVAKIAEKLANKEYVKSPKSSNIPIYDILFSIGDISGSILEGFGRFISRIYKVGSSLISSFVGRFVYYSLITILLIIGVFYLGI
ncbi:hypothetical protein [Ruminococcus sp.]